MTDVSTIERDGKALTAVFASITATGIAWGTMIPLLTVLMERDGVPATLIGLNSAMPVLAVMVTARLMPWIGRHIGLSPAMFGGLLVIAAGAIAMAYWRSYEAWLVLRFVIGLAGAIHWILSEAWINTLAPPERRGFYVGVYGALFMAGFAIGPLGLTIIPLDGVLPFALIAVGVLLSGIPLYVLRARLPKLDDSPHRASFAPFFVAPAVFLASLAAGLSDGALWALLTVYGIDKGIGEAGALHLLAALNVGTVLLQIPLGWAADRHGAGAILIACGVAGVAGGLLLPLVITGPSVLLLWALAFVWGAMLASLYTVGLVELGRFFQGAALTGANGLFVAAYSLGGLSGPLTAGYAMDGTGPDALPVFIVVVTAAFLAFAIAESARRRPD